MSTSDNCVIISSNIDISQNEYVTKYSFNRNFQKLIQNDAILKSNIESDSIDTYGLNKTYNKDSYVFFKTSPSSIQLYILKSKIANNSNKPLVDVDDNGNLYAVTSDHWEVIGSFDETGHTPKDTANRYIADATSTFLIQHQNNKDLSSHPTGKLGIDESEYLFKSFNNISDNRQALTYPYELRSYLSNDSIYSGYMRKWDNGLLEYDFIFRLGYAGKAQDGQDIISANNYVAPKQGNNFIYFKDDDDYKIFNKGGKYYVNTDDTKQVNLNTTINAYTAKLDFIEQFKDLNYMVFTSNVKNIDTEAHNTKVDVISNYDSRLTIDGLTVVDTDTNASFKNQIVIPNEIVNIKEYALSYILKTAGYRVVINIDPEQSRLANIDNRAFSISEIDTIHLPYSVRYIGKNAFDSCEHLSSIVFYVERDSRLQPKIDKDAFINTNIESISVIYRSEEPTLLASDANPDDDNTVHDILYISNEHLSEKLKNSNYRYQIGISSNPSIVVINEPPTPQPLIASSLLSVHNDENDSMTNIITIDVNEFLAELQARNNQKNSRMLFSNSPMHPSIDAIFNIENGTITSYDDYNIVLSGIAIDLSDRDDISAIGDNALNGFDKLTSLSTGNVTSFGIGAFGNHFNELVLPKQVEANLSNTTFNTLCVFNADTKLTVDTIENCYFVGEGLNIPANALSAHSVINLHLIDVSQIQSSAFWNIDAIENVYIHSNEDGAILSSNIFKYKYEEEKDDVNNIIDAYYENAIQNIYLIGDNWEILASAFVGLDINYLSIDMNDSYLAQHSIISSNIATFDLSNILKSEQDVKYQGLYAGSLLNTQIAHINLYDVDLSCDDLLVNKIDISASGVYTPIAVTTSSDSQILTNKKWQKTPDYLSVSDTDITVLKGITRPIENVIIPSYIEQIDTLTIDENAITDINYIYVPKSVKSIADDAFANMVNLNSIEFERGIELTSIGKDIFKHCESLEDVVFLK